MNKLFLNTFILFLKINIVLVGLSWADQNVVIKSDVYKKVSTIIKPGVSIREYCLPCGDLDYKEVRVDKLTRGMDGDFRVNGKSFDLSYTYFLSGDKWKNLAIHLGLESIRTPLYLPPKSKLYFLIGLINYWEDLRYSDMEENITLYLKKSLDLGYDRAGVVLNLIKSKNYGEVQAIYDSVEEEMTKESFYLESDKKVNFKSKAEVTEGDAKEDLEQGALTTTWWKQALKDIKEAIKNWYEGEPKKSKEQEVEKQKGNNSSLLGNVQTIDNPCTPFEFFTPEEQTEAYNFGIKIQQAFREKDIESILNMINGELEVGPRKKDMIGKSFGEVFSDEWSKAILAKKPNCTWLRANGPELGNKLWYDEMSGGWSIHAIRDLIIKDQPQGMTEIKNTQRNQTCGNIKYSIINLGPDEYTGRPNTNHIVANIFNSNGETVLKTDSTSSIDLTCKDVTGDGQPELVLDTWGGGNCSWCNKFYAITDKQTGGQSKVEILYEGEGFKKIEYNQKRSINEISTCFHTSFEGDHSSWPSDCKTLCLDSREGFCKATLSNQMKNESEKINFKNIKNDDLIEFALKTQKENLDSNKSIDEKVVLQQRLIDLLKDRNVRFRLAGIDIKNGLYEFWFFKCIWPEDDELCDPGSVKPEWTGKEWDYKDENSTVANSNNKKSKKGFLEWEYLNAEGECGQGGSCVGPDKRLQNGLDRASKGDFENAHHIWRIMARECQRNKMTCDNAWRKGKKAYAKAQYNLAVTYYKGQGVSKDIKASAKFMKLSAEQGLSQAQSKMAFMYKNGKGVLKDIKEAVKWSKLAMEQGTP